MSVKDYTDLELEEQLGLIELHINRYPQDENFCLSCIRKHINNISGLSKEGLSVSGQRIYSKLTKWVGDIRKGNFSSIPEIGKQAREFRKKLVGESTIEASRDERLSQNPRIAELEKKAIAIAEKVKREGIQDNAE